MATTNAGTGQYLRSIKDLCHTLGNYDFESNDEKIIAATQELLDEKFEIAISVNFRRIMVRDKNYNYVEFRKQMKLSDAILMAFLLKSKDETSTLAREIKFFANLNKYDMDESDISHKHIVDPICKMVATKLTKSYGWRKSTDLELSWMVRALILHVIMGIAGFRYGYESTWNTINANSEKISKYSTSSVSDNNWYVSGVKLFKKYNRLMKTCVCIVKDRYSIESIDSEDDLYISKIFAKHLDDYIEITTGNHVGILKFAKRSIHLHEMRNVAALLCLPSELTIIICAYLCKQKLHGALIPAVRDIGGCLYVTHYCEIPTLLEYY